VPDQTFNLNLKAHDQGWEGKQVQIYNCAECGTDSSGAQAHSNWHDDLTNQLQQLAQAIQQEAQARQQGDQQEQQRATGVEANLQAQINTKT
jgi:Zn ribbon nucleic-acid-binding protein